MWRMLQNKALQDFVIVIGETRPVADFLAEASASAGLNCWDHVETDTALMRPTELLTILGRPMRAVKILVWNLQTSMADVISDMVTVLHKRNSVASEENL